MKEHPILFNGEMVKAILEFIKTNTRRLDGLQEINKNPGDWTVNACFHGGIFTHKSTEESVFVKAKYQVGDHLWVRETFAEVGTFDPPLVIYRASYPECVPPQFDNIPSIENITWRPSIHMPRSASRITLEVTNVRVQRIQDISEEDAIAEGAIRNNVEDEDWDGTYLTSNYIAGVEGSENDEPCDSAYQWYRMLWDSLYKESDYGWQVNPWVFAYTFKVLEVKK